MPCESIFWGRLFLPAKQYEIDECAPFRKYVSISPSITMISDFSGKIIKNVWRFPW